MFNHLIVHRKNNIKDLVATSSSYGIEVDVRSYGTDLIIHHDPFAEGENFEHWIKYYSHGTLILNVKEEGLEQRLLRVLEEENIDDFFFLDQSFPFLIKTSKSGERRCAVRASEFESIETVLTLVNKVDWVWVDCFSRFPLTQTDYAALRENDFKLCLVSPELQGRNAEIEIPQMAQLIQSENMYMDAICTKLPNLWENVKK